MKAKTIEKETDNSRVYKIAKRATVNIGCPICSPYKGCNSRFRIKRSWKYYRKTRWK